MTAPMAVLRPELQIVPLDAAVLCMDCGVISNTTFAACPGCAGRALMPLSIAVTDLVWEAEHGVPVLGIGEGR